MDRDGRRKLIVELLRSRVITSATDLSAALAERGVDATAVTLGNDLRAIGAVRTPLPGVNSGYRYRTPDLVTTEDVTWALAERVGADGLSVVKLSANFLVIRTTKGTANAVSSLVKLLKDHELDDNIVLVMTDDDEFVLIALADRTGDYVRMFREWLR